MSAASWDGLLDDGTIAPKDTYTIKGVSGSPEYTWEGVIGNTNTSSVRLGANDPGLLQAESEFLGMAIPPASTPGAGNIYIASGYNEARVPTLKTTTAAPQDFTYIDYKGFHGIGQTSYLVCTDGTYVYWGG
jgi:hypothetical protein